MMQDSPWRAEIIVCLALLVPIVPFVLFGEQSESDYQARKFAMLQGGSRNEVIFRQGDWKLIINSNHELSKFEPVALFNLKDNISELEKLNLIQSKQHEKRVTQMFQQYMETRNSLQPTVSS